MNPVTTILLATVFGLCALLVVGGGLIQTSRKRKRAVALGGRDRPSRILNDLRPIEDLLVDFVRHSSGLGAVLAVVTTADKPRSFARIVHEIRIARETAPHISVAAHLVAAALGKLFVAGLIRVNRAGFIATEAGREVQLRLEKGDASPG